MIDLSHTPSVIWTATEWNNRFGQSQQVIHNGHSGPKSFNVTRGGAWNHYNSREDVIGLYVGCISAKDIIHLGPAGYGGSIEESKLNLSLVPNPALDFCGDRWEWDCRPKKASHAYEYPSQCSFCGGVKPGQFMEQFKRIGGELIFTDKKHKVRWTRTLMGEKKVFSVYFYHFSELELLAWEKIIAKEEGK